jgi:hypothetical protein
MIANLIGGFVAILVGVVLVGPIATQVVGVTKTANASGTACTAITEAGCSGTANALHIASSWGATVLNMVPGFFALGVMGICCAPRDCPV